MTSEGGLRPSIYHLFPYCIRQAYGHGDQSRCRRPRRIGTKLHALDAVYHIKHMTSVLPRGTGNVISAELSFSRSQRGNNIHSLSLRLRLFSLALLRISSRLKVSAARFYTQVWILVTLQCYRGNTIVATPVMGKA